MTAKMLGKQPVVYDEKLLRLENYLNLPKLPPLPETSDWFAKATKPPMYANDKYGDCVVAGAGHMIQVWTANAGRFEQVLSEKTIVDTYFKLTDGQDIGLNLLAFLRYWRHEGLGYHKIGLYVGVDPKNIISMRYANYLFGGIYLGIMLPKTAEKQFDEFVPWETPKEGPFGDGAVGSWGGHCVAAGTTTPRMMKVSTWGREQWATWDFIGNYCDEAYAILSLEWFTVDHVTPAGFYWRDLKKDLQAVVRL